MSHFYSINFICYFIVGNDIEDSFAVKYIAFEKDIFPPAVLSLSLIVLSYVTLFLLKLVKKKRTVNIFHKEIEVKNNSDVQFEKILRYISNNFNDPEISILSINRETGIYEKRISQMIKHKTGLTFKQYLNTIRLNEARRLMQKTDCNITEIALHCGYSNSSHFTRVFKQFFNMSPRDYRKNILIKTNTDSP